MTLVIMAAGMGSRFGGPKQIAPILPTGEFTMDFAIFDAIRAGFSKVVIIVKRDFLEHFSNKTQQVVAKETKKHNIFFEM